MSCISKLFELYFASPMEINNIQRYTELDSMTAKLQDFRWFEVDNINNQIPEQEQQNFKKERHMKQ